jgi:hypothetical protein
MSWGHEEYDVRGQLVARYESFEETRAAGELVSGWRRFNPQGELTAEGSLGSAAGKDNPALNPTSSSSSLARQA